MVCNENLRWPVQPTPKHGEIHLAFVVEEDGSLPIFILYRF